MGRDSKMQLSAITQVKLKQKSNLQPYRMWDYVGRTICNLNLGDVKTDAYGALWPNASTRTKNDPPFTYNVTVLLTSENANLSATSFVHSKQRVSCRVNFKTETGTVVTFASCPASLSHNVITQRQRQHQHWNF